MCIVTWCLGVGASKQSGQSVLLAGISAWPSKGPKALSKSTLLLLLLLLRQWKWGILPSTLRSTIMFRSDYIAKELERKRFARAWRISRDNRQTKA
jgi:hypothetical protein